MGGGNKRFKSFFSAVCSDRKKKKKRERPKKE